MVINKNLWLRKSELEDLRALLSHEPASESECFGEDKTISHTVSFGNGVEMDIKVCGVQYHEGESNTAWSEAVLFVNGSEVACSEPSDAIDGEWILDHDGDEFRAVVRELPTELSIGDFLEYTRKNFSVSSDALALINNILEFFQKNLIPEDALANTLTELFDGIGYDPEEILALEMCGGNKKER